MTIPISTIVDVNIVVGPQFPARGNFSILNIITMQTGVIDSVERLRYYATIDEVAADWGGTDEAFIAATTYFSQSPTPNLLAISFRDDATENITTSLDAIQDVEANWYGFMFTKEIRDLVAGTVPGVDTAVEDAAAWAQARVKVFGNITNSADAKNPAISTDIGSLLNLAGFTRTFTDYDSDVDQYVSASVFGRAFTVNFGQTDSTITLKFKTLPGITPVTLLSSEKIALDGKRINSYTQFGNATDAVSMYSESYMAADLFFDEIHNIDWLSDSIQNQVFGALYTDTTKVRLTDKGGAQLEQQVIKVLDEAVNNGMLAAGTTSDGVFLPNGYITNVQDVADIPDAMRQARIGPNVDFIALLSGAVHAIQINGTAER